MIPISKSEAKGMVRLMRTILQLEGTDTKTSETKRKASNSIKYLTKQIKDNDTKTKKYYTVFTLED